MLPEEKRAIFVMVVFGFLMVVVFLVLMGLLGKGAMGWLILVWLISMMLVLSSQWFIRKREHVQDERDWAVAQRASMLGYYASFCALFLGCGMPWLFLGREARDTVPVPYLQCLAWGGWSLFWLVRSVAVLILYRRWGGHAQD